MLRNRKILKLKFFIVVGACFILLLYLALTKKGISKDSFICIKEKCFTVEIADTPSEREYGLMNRKELAEDSGMLFVFEKENVNKFWMKNTLIPLDMIWIDVNNRIVFIKKNVQPCNADPCEIYGPDQNTKYVLEINGGEAEKTGVMIGDIVKIQDNI